MWTLHRKVALVAVGRDLCEDGGPSDLVPNPESFPSKLSIISGSEQMASRAEVRSDDAMDLNKTLGVLSGFEPSHSPLAFTRWLMRVLSSVIEIPMLSMSNAGQHHSFRCPVAT
jgi:hypothetical protein